MINMRQILNHDQTMFHLKNKKVKEIIENEYLLEYITRYRSFLANKESLAISVQQIGIESKIECRVKLLNSIQSKITKYTKEHENGEISINKCINDIFGTRIIINENISFEELKKELTTKFKNIKITNSDKKEGYRANHIYFITGDNYSFPWELQVWFKDNEKTNKECHYNYKQEYTKWEKEGEYK